MAWAYVRNTLSRNSLECMISAWRGCEALITWPPIAARQGVIEGRVQGGRDSPCWSARPMARRANH